jgi:GTP-binding protein HflX
VDVTGAAPVLVRAGAISWDEISHGCTAPHANPRHRRSERAALIGLITGRARKLDAERSLDELAGLAQAAGAEVVLRVLQERPKPDPSTFLGAGKIKTLAASASELNVDIVIFDNELTPAQLRQIEEEVDRKVIDRTQLILDIFARRARTREGKMQVELAQLQYLLPRLAGSGTALSRLGGGIGSRGPGETKLETDRRRIRTRSRPSATTSSRSQAPLAAARAAAQDLGAHRRAGRLHQRRQDDAVQRADRADAEASNACSSRSTRWCAGAAAGQPRAAALGHGRLHRSIAARAGRGVSRHARGDGGRRSRGPRDRRRGAGPRPRMHAVQSVLDEVGAIDVPLLEVYNKCDALTDDERRRLHDLDPSALCISALHRQGIDELIETITSRLALDVRRVTLTFDPGRRRRSRADRPRLPPRPRRAARDARRPGVDRRRRPAPLLSIVWANIVCALRLRQASARLTDARCCWPRRLSACAPKTRAGAGRDRAEVSRFHAPVGAAGDVRHACGDSASRAAGRSCRPATSRRRAGVRRGAEGEPAFYPAETSLGYVELARKDAQGGAAAFRSRARAQPAGDDVGASSGAGRRCSR